MTVPHRTPRELLPSPRPQQQTLLVQSAIVPRDRGVQLPTCSDGGSDEYTSLRAAGSLRRAGDGPPTTVARRGHGGASGLQKPHDSALLTKIGTSDRLILLSSNEATQGPVPQDSAVPGPS